MPQKLLSLIFDLDGTLTDSKPGILGCLKEVLDARHLSGCGPLDRFIGPPVEEWVAELLPGGTAEDRKTLASDYRACYDRVGWRNNSVYPGVEPMLAQLAGAGFPLYVCTSKHEHFAVRILEEFGVAQYFRRIYGDRIELESHSKIDLLARILHENSIAPDSAWMIGDRSFDFEAAQTNGIRSIAAGWGYGSPEECSAADVVAKTPAEVCALALSAAVSPSEPASSHNIRA